MRDDDDDDDDDDEDLEDEEEERYRSRRRTVLLGFRPVRTPNAINVGLPVLLGDLIPSTHWDNPSVVVSP